ncbi:hypothetical protein DDI_2648 [Dickeya dianthicola RNS04.9]|nr:hypothetical protein DDI_2648 [Dickeya dianthicola RNS04.9]
MIENIAIPHSSMPGSAFLRCLREKKIRSELYIKPCYDRRLPIFSSGA